jgi:hypothetical protein
MQTGLRYPEPRAYPGITAASLLLTSYFLLLTSYSLRLPPQGNSPELGSRLKSIRPRAPKYWNLIVQSPGRPSLVT